MFDGLSLDPFSLIDDGFGPVEVGVCGCHIVQALLIALVVVMLDERLDLRLQVTGQEVVLQRLVPALDPRLRVDMPCPGSGCGSDQPP